MFLTKKGMYIHHTWNFSKFWGGPRPDAFKKQAEELQLRRDQLRYVLTESQRQEERGIPAN